MTSASPPLHPSPTATGSALARQPLTTLKGVGPTLAEKLAKLGLHTVQDLLFHLPLRYEDRGTVRPIGSLAPGRLALVEAEVQLADVRLGRRRALLVRLRDGSGSLTLRFFHFNKAQQAGFTLGSRVRAFGEVRPGPAGLEMVHPEYQLLREDTPAPAAGLTPVYPATEGVTQQRLRQLVEQALTHLHTPGALDDYLPPALSQGVPLARAVHTLHHPRDVDEAEALMAAAHPAHQRLAFEELLAHQLSLARLRARLQALPAPALPARNELAEHLIASLPFPLTGAQVRVGQEIAADLHQPRPMLRLVQGDVGAGKTVVAALAACQALAAGYQVAVMAPTELLAEQHAQNFRHWFEPLGVDVGWLSGKQKAAARREAEAAVAAGRARLVVGTHALFQDSIQFQRLGLTIIDEQHRFGVHQRLKLREKGGDSGLTPHQLILTATPIPRTLAMSAYGDLDTSLLDELPPGRQPVQTLTIPNERRPEIVERIRASCVAGRQAYWVCPLIEESEALEAQAAEATYAELLSLLPELNIGLVHGRLPAKEKAAVMAAFKAGELHLLIATTVIEVGVDVPNASLMVIENPERLGLAQLHQLRGRVGRGTTQSYCVLLYQNPLGQLSRARLAILRETNDGFRIAERDLELRGPGEVLGTRQTGLASLRIADLLRDQHLLPQIQTAARELWQAQPDRVEPLIRRWLGEGERFGAV